MAKTGKELLDSLAKDGHELPFWKRAIALGYEGEKSIRPAILELFVAQDKPLQGEELFSRLKEIRPLDLPMGIEAELCGYPDQEGPNGFDRFYDRSAKFNELSSEIYDFLRIAITVNRAPFIELYSIGDPDEEDYIEDVEVRGRATGTIELDIRLDDVPKAIEFLMGHESISSLQDWAIENVSEEWTSQIGMLDQDVSESGLPHDDEVPQELDSAQVDLVDSIVEIEFLRPNADNSALESSATLSASGEVNTSDDLLDTNSQLDKNILIGAKAISRILSLLAKSLNL